jgi:CheY-like chemotaxis protein
MPNRSSPDRRLHLAILNDSPRFLKMLCDWFQKHGHHCKTAIVAEMPQAHVEVERFISAHNYDVVVYDVPMPYASSWDLLDVIRTMPSLRSQQFVVTTRNKRKLQQAVGRTSTLEITGAPDDLQRLLKAVETAGHRSQQNRRPRSGERNEARYVGGN